MCDTRDSRLTAEKVDNAESSEVMAKMYEFWQQVFDLLHKRVREDFPEIGPTDRRVRDAWRW